MGVGGEADASLLPQMRLRLALPRLTTGEMAMGRRPAERLAFAGTSSIIEARRAEAGEVVPAAVKRNSCRYLIRI